MAEIDDIAGWLAGLGLGKYESAFAEAEIDAEILAELDDGDLRELGLPLDPRKKLMKAIAGLGQPTVAAIVENAAGTAATMVGERRQVTVLFADISGFTTHSEGRDAEETHALLNGFFAAVDGIVTAYGGCIDKHIGDAVMAVFGAPVAHADDPERALRAAFEIHAAVARLDPPLAVHIGIASGQVVASGTGSEAHSEYTMTGDSVNLASRLTEMAASRETLISETAWGAVSALLEGEPLGETRIDGFAEPVSVWRAVADRAARPFAGRRRELRQFEGALEDCLEAGRGQTLIVRGEAGIGKTRLVEEFQRLAEAQDFQVHSGLVLDFGVGKGQDAIRALVRSLLAVPPDGGKSERLAARQRAVDGGLLDADHLVHLNDLLDLEQPPALSLLYDAMDNQTRNRGKQEAVSTLVERTSRSTFLMLRIEDVHWADGIVLAHLGHLAATVAECTALLVLTSRIEGDPLNQAWRSATGGAPLNTIDIGPLRDDEALALAGDFLDVSSIFAESCIARAGGNPLFLEQLLRNAEETSAERVPGSVRSIVQARLDSLDAGDREALLAASVMGQRFGLEALRHLIERPDYLPDALIAHYLVRPEGAGYLFAHALIQEGAYESLLKQRRRELHRRAAAWFAEADPVLRAEHLFRAEDPAAAGAFLIAAMAQIDAYRFERALQLAEQGLSVASEAADRFALTCLQGEVLRTLGQAGRSIEAYQQALVHSATDAEKCQAWIGLAEGMRIADRIEKALGLLEQAQAIAESCDLQGDLSRLHHLRGNLYFPMGRIDGCREEHELALRYARSSGSAEAEARALGGLGDAAYARGHMRTSHDSFERCAEICREHGFGGVEVANASMIGHIRLYLFNFRESHASSLETIEKARRVGHGRAELMAHLAANFSCFELDDLVQTRHHTERSMELAKSLQARRFETGPLGRVLIK